MKIFHICNYTTWEKYQYRFGVHHTQKILNDKIVLISEMGQDIQSKFEAEPDVIPLPDYCDYKEPIGDAAIHLAHLGITPQHSCFDVVKKIRKSNPFFRAASL